jgi:hypothetical protein
MYSFFWNFVNSKTLTSSPRISYILLVLLSIVFSLPRYEETWFFYAALAYPLLVIGILSLTKRLLPLVMRVQNISLELVEKKTNREQLK